MLKRLPTCQQYVHKLAYAHEKRGWNVKSTGTRDTGEFWSR